MGQIQFTKSLLLIALFSIAVIGFSLNFASDNNSAVNIADDPEIINLYSNSEGNVSSFGTTSEDTYTSIIDTSISAESGGAQSVAPFSLTTKNALGSVENMLEVGYVKIFGSGSGFGIFLTAFISFLILISVLYIYKTLRGSPD